MARIDREAARRELVKAAECDAQADELTSIAATLREQARCHKQEADELRGIVRRVNRRRLRRMPRRNQAANLSRAH